MSVLDALVPDVMRPMAWHLPNFFLASREWTFCTVLWTRLMHIFLSDDGLDPRSLDYVPKTEHRRLVRARIGHDSRRMEITHPTHYLLLAGIYEEHPYPKKTRCNMAHWMIFTGYQRLAPLQSSMAARLSALGGRHYLEKKLSAEEKRLAFPDPEDICQKSLIIDSIPKTDVRLLIRRYGILLRLVTFRSTSIVMKLGHCPTYLFDTIYPMIKATAVQQFRDHDNRTHEFVMLQSSSCALYIDLMEYNLRRTAHIQDNQGGFAIQHIQSDCLHMYAQYVPLVSFSVSGWFPLWRAGLLPVYFSIMGKALARSIRRCNHEGVSEYELVMKTRDESIIISYLHLISPIAEEDVEWCGRKINCQYIAACFARLNNIPDTLAAYFEKHDFRSLY